MPKKITIDDIILRFVLKHGDKYNYSLVEYHGYDIKVKIICPNHGIFEQRPHGHLRGQGCPICGGTGKLTKDVFIAKANAKYDSWYDYTLVEYINNKTPIKIICPDHGVFEQRPDNHLWGFGCLKCGLKNCSCKDNNLYIQRLTVEKGPVEVNNEIQCRCSYCKNYFKPSRSQLISRIKALEGKHQSGESRLYCSDGCKSLCPIYGRSKYPKHFKPDISRPDQPELREMVLERDNNQCQRCGSSEDLHCHHITGVEINPIESADIDNCITLCKECHGKVHSDNGCHYSDFKRQPCII